MEGVISLGMQRAAFREHYSQTAWSARSNQFFARLAGECAY